MPEKVKQYTKRDDGVELETQVILRIPEAPARVLREAIRDGVNDLADRLTIKLENDLRYGEVYLDNWLLYGKLVDLPTVIESLKTIDSKSFYKTADICQMLICKDEPEIPTPEEELPKNKKKDPNKVDKKYLWPHGITPPCKNVRKRRFRKTLKKKFVEAPEIEKEVKRLLRADNEAVNVKWDLINEDEENKNNPQQMSQQDQSMQDSNTSANDVPAGDGDAGGNDSGVSGAGSGTGIGDIGKIGKSQNDSNVEQLMDSQQMPRDIDIFGEDVSSSDDDDDHNNIINVDVDETSRLSADDMSDYSMQGVGSVVAAGGTAAGGTSDNSYVTEFNKHMFNDSPRKSGVGNTGHSRPSGFYGTTNEEMDQSEIFVPQMSQEAINLKIAEIRRQLNELQNQRIQKEQEISSIVNQTLRQRLQDALDNILGQILDKEMELQDYQ